MPTVAGSAAPPLVWKELSLRHSRAGVPSGSVVKVSRHQY